MIAVLLLTLLGAAKPSGTPVSPPDDAVFRALQDELTRAKALRMDLVDVDDFRK